MLRARSKEAERAGYQAVPVAAVQQSERVPDTQQIKPTHGTETPMDIDQETQGAASGMKRKAEEGPSEESKKARVGAFPLASRPRQHLKIE